MRSAQDYVQAELQEKAISCDRIQVSRPDLIAIAEVFLILEKWQYDLDLNEKPVVGSPERSGAQQIIGT